MTSELPDSARVSRRQISALDIAAILQLPHDQRDLGNDLFRCLSEGPWICSDREFGTVVHHFLESGLCLPNIVDAVAEMFDDKRPLTVGTLRSHLRVKRKLRESSLTRRTHSEQIPPKEPGKKGKKSNQISEKAIVSPIEPSRAVTREEPAVAEAALAKPCEEPVVAEMRSPLSEQRKQSAAPEGNLREEPPEHEDEISAVRLPDNPIVAETGQHPAIPFDDPTQLDFQRPLAEPREDSAAVQNGSLLGVPIDEPHAHEGQTLRIEQQQPTAKVARQGLFLLFPRLY